VVSLSSSSESMSVYCSSTSSCTHARSTNRHASKVLPYWLQNTGLTNAFEWENRKNHKEEPNVTLEQ
jgi:hypothetical protein